MGMMYALNYHEPKYVAGKRIDAPTWRYQRYKMFNEHTPYAREKWLETYAPLVHNRMAVLDDGIQLLPY